MATCRSILFLRKFFYRPSVDQPHSAVLTVSDQAIAIIDTLMATIFPDGAEGAPAAPQSLPPLGDLLRSVAQSLGSTQHAPSEPTYREHGTGEKPNLLFATMGAFDMRFTPNISRRASGELASPPRVDAASANGNLVNYQMGPDVNGEFDSMASLHALLDVVGNHAPFPGQAEGMTFDWSQFLGPVNLLDPTPRPF